MTSATSERWLAAIPTLFVLLWSTGFLGARLGLPYAEPFTFLGIRMVIATALLLALALATRAPWPSSAAQAGHMAVAGLLVHGAYLGGVFNAINTGLPAGVAALLVGIQPLLTAALAGWLLKEQVSTRQWLGLALGLVGVALVVGGRLTGGTVTVLGMASILLALLGITLGTLYQKHYCAYMDLRSGGVVQYAATAVVMVLGAWLFETMDVEWTGEFVFALAWLVLVLSVGAVGLLYTLIRRGEASRVASLFYLTPPTVAVLAWLMFGETLSGTALVGMGVVVVAVAMVNAPGRRP